MTLAAAARDACVVAFFALCGCGVSGVAAASAVGGGGGGGGSKPSPPTARVSPPTGTLSNYVTLGYVLHDPQVSDSGGARIRVTPQFRVRPLDPWIDMTPAPDGDPTNGLALGEHEFVWNTIVDLGDVQDVRVRVTAQYEGGPRGRAFRSNETTARIDARLGATVLGGAATSDAPEVTPVDVRAFGDGFLVACSGGADIVERVDGGGEVTRVVGLGLATSTSLDDAAHLGVVSVPKIVSFDVDAAGNLFLDHDTYFSVVSRTPVGVLVGARDGPDADSDPDTVVAAPDTVRRAPIRGFDHASCIRVHPSGALVVYRRITGFVFGTDLFAVNPLDPLDPESTPLVVAGVTIAPGTMARIAGHGLPGSSEDGVAGLAATIDDLGAGAIGPDGEIYYVDPQRKRIRVLNAGTADLVLPGRTLAPGTLATVAGGGLEGGPRGDGGPATQAALRRPRGIACSPTRALFIADTPDSPSEVRIRVANLGDAPVTFAGATIAPGAIDSVAGGGGGAAPAAAREFGFDQISAVALDASGNLLVAEGGDVILVNGGTETVTAYGQSTGPARTAVVYDAAARGGIPLQRPRAALLRDPVSTEIFFTDRTSVRVLNLATKTTTFGAVSVEPGRAAVVGGGAAPGFVGDAGPALRATFDSPSALASDGGGRLFVADTGNDRIRMIHVGAAADGPETFLGVSIAPGETDTVVGGAAGPLSADGDGLAPRDCSLSRPLGVAWSPDGLLFIADTGHHRVRCVNPGTADAAVAGVVVAPGTIATIVGGGVPGSSADGAGPWLVDGPTAVAVDRELLYVADSGNARIRAVNLTDSVVRVAGRDVPPREMRTICGNGVRGNFGDLGPAASARIDTPRSLFLVTDSGTRRALLFADGPQHVVRLVNLTDGDLPARLGPDDLTTLSVPAHGIVAVAGGPNLPGTPNFPAFAGDGLPPSEARFSSPWGVVVTTKRDHDDPALRAGCLAGLFVMDEGNDRVRRLGPPPVRPCTRSP